MIGISYCAVFMNKEFSRMDGDSSCPEQTQADNAPLDNHSTL